VRLLEFDLLHGAVLAALIRRAGAVAFRVRALDPEAGWTLIAFEGGMTVGLSHRTRARRETRGDGGWGWRFSFGPDHLAALRRAGHPEALHLALICGRGTGTRPEVALLEPQEVTRLLDLGYLFPQTLTVRAVARKELRVSTRRARLKIPRRRLDQERTGDG
jgi:hypothetical protein